MLVSISLNKTSYFNNCVYRNNLIPKMTDLIMWHLRLLPVIKDIYYNYSKFYKCRQSSQYTTPQNGVSWSQFWVLHCIIVSYNFFLCLLCY